MMFDSLLKMYMNTRKTMSSKMKYAMYKEKEKNIFDRPICMFFKCNLGFDSSYRDPFLVKEYFGTKHDGINEWCNYLLKQLTCPKNIFIKQDYVRRYCNSKVATKGKEVIKALNNLTSGKL